MDIFALAMQEAGMEGAFRLAHPVSGHQEGLFVVTLDNLRSLWTGFSPSPGKHLGGRLKGTVLQGRVLQGRVHCETFRLRTTGI